MGQIQSQMQWILTYFSLKFLLCTYSHDWWLMWKSFNAVNDLMVKLRKLNHQIDISGSWLYWRGWNNVQTCYSFADSITESSSLVAVVSSCCAMCCVCDSGILVVLLILSALLTSVALLLFYDFEQPCDKAVLNSTVRIYLHNYFRFHIYVSI